MGTHYNKKKREELKELFLEALEDSRGMITTSCKRAGITKQTVSNWRKDDPEFARRVEEIKDAQKEWVQGQLMTMIANGSTTAAIFFLKTQCGWKEAKEVEITTKQQIDVEKVLEDISKTLGEGE